MDLLKRLTDHEELLDVLADDRSHHLDPNVIKTVRQGMAPGIFQIPGKIEGVSGNRDVLVVDLPEGEGENRYVRRRTVGSLDDHGYRTLARDGVGKGRAN